MKLLIRRASSVASVLVALTACSEGPLAPPSQLTDAAFRFSGSDEEPTGTSDYFAAVNRQALLAGRNVMISRAELLVSSNAPVSLPRVLFANDRSLRLDTRWVPRDLRRLATDATLSYAVFAPLANAAIGGPAEAALDASYATWNQVTCSNLRVVKKALPDNVLPSFLLTGQFPPADINDLGFVPASIFDLVFGAGASQYVIGVTVTFSFLTTDENGIPVLDGAGNPIPTDIDRDGRFDTAFKEVWFNNALPYTTTGEQGYIDIESAALHEHGHALELGHFGRIVGDPRTGKLHVSPRAVMNAVNLGVARTPFGSDNAALCGNYAGWN